MIIFLFVVLAELGTEALLKSARLHINYSDSVPVGLYRETPESTGVYAAICVPKATFERAVRAGLEVIPGNCPGAGAPILKPVVWASRKSPVAFTEEGFVIGGKLRPNTAPKTHSKTGAPLDHFPFGVYRSGLWAVSGFNRDSFDSRYFGPVNSDAILFYAKPVWTK